MMPRRPTCRPAQTVSEGRFLLVSTSSPRAHSRDSGDDAPVAFRLRSGLSRAYPLGYSARVSGAHRQMAKCASDGGGSSKQKLKKHALPAIEAVIGVVSPC